MTDPKQQARKEILDTIIACRVASFALDLLPNQEFDFPVEISLSTLNKRPTLHIHIPYDLNALRQYRKALGPGWKSCNKTWLITQHGNGLTQHMSYYKSPKRLSISERTFEIMITLDPTLSKSACQIRQTGTKEIPVYEIVCS